MNLCALTAPQIIRWVGALKDAPFSVLWLHTNFRVTHLDFICDLFSLQKTSDPADAHDCGRHLCLQGVVKLGYWVWAGWWINVLFFLIIAWCDHFTKSLGLIAKATTSSSTITGNKTKRITTTTYWIVYFFIYVHLLSANALEVKVRDVLFKSADCQPNPWSTPGFPWRVCVWRTTY